MVEQPADNAADPQDASDDINLGAVPPSTQDSDADTAEQQNIPELSELAVELHHHLEEAKRPLNVHTIFMMLPMSHCQQLNQMPLLLLLLNCKNWWNPLKPMPIRPCPMLIR